MSTLGALSFVLLSLSPAPGLLAAIPLAILKLGYPPWFVLLTATPLAYVQVFAVHLLWESLQKLSFVKNVIENKRSARVDSMLATGGSFVPVFLATPVIGPWGVVIFMKYGRVPLRKVALPIAVSLACIALVVTGLCVYVPAFFA